MKNYLKTQNNNYKHIEKAIKYIDKNFKNQPSINEIAKNIGMSKYHFIRVFKDYVGVTPKQFLHSITLNYAKEHIKKSKSLLQSSLDIGLSSTSRLHELFVNLIGVTPNEYKQKGKNVLITYGYGETPFGEALIAFTTKGICYLGFIDSNREQIFDRFIEIWGNANLVFNNKLALEYIENIFIKNKKYNLLVNGTNFQINVWKALLNLPNGLLSTYQDIANYIDKPKSVRAVATAIGKNHIGYLIPCHRVIAKSGAMSGYRWGIERKKILIAYEINSKDEKMKLKVADINDIDSVLKLHYKYQIDSIKEEDKKDGFVTTPFTKDELKALIEKEQGLFIAIQKNEVVAYVMCASWQFWSAWAMFAFMIKDLPNLKYLGQKLSIDNSYQYGPICIDKSVRGTGVLQELFDFARSHLAKRYPILVTFINKINTRSYTAHTKKLGLEIIQEFEYNNNQYYELVYDTSKSIK